MAPIAVGFGLGPGPGLDGATDPPNPVIGDRSFGRQCRLFTERAELRLEQRLAEVSKHLCPSLLAAELAKLKHDVQVYVSHLKPGQIELVMGEIAECAGQFRPQLLQTNQVFEF